MKEREGMFTYLFSDNHKKKKKEEWLNQQTFFNKLIAASQNPDVNDPKKVGYVTVFNHSQKCSPPLAGRNAGAVRQSPWLFIQTRDGHQNRSSWGWHIYSSGADFFLKTLIKILKILCSILIIYIQI